MRLLSRFGLLAGSLLVVAISAEGILRVAKPWLALPRFRPGGYLDSQLHHRYPPSARMHDRFGRERYVVETNEDGLRSRWSRDAFRDQGLRIALLGDSFAFGYGLPREQTVSAQLERHLRDGLERDDIAVLNSGIITYSPLLARGLFEDVVRHYSPTATLLLLDISDIADDHQYAGQRPTGGRARRFAVADQAFPDSPLRSLALWNLATPVQRVVRDWLPPPPPRGRRPAPIVIDGEDQRDHFFVLRHPLAKTRPFFEAMLANIGALAAQARDVNSEFALVVGPRHLHWDASESPRNPEAPKYGADSKWHGEYIRFFDEVAPELDYPVIELLPAFRAARASTGRPLVFEHDPHWNASGHAVAADVLAAFFTRRASNEPGVSDRMGRPQPFQGDTR